MLDKIDPQTDVVPTVTVGGLAIAVLDRRSCANRLVAASRQHGPEAPLFHTSANGEVVARISRDPELARLFLDAYQVVADGQPLVVASRFLCARPLPERIATTDLFHDVAQIAEENGTTFYLFGATAERNGAALAAVRRDYPRLNIVGASHGYLEGQDLDDKLAEINALAPDILWLGLGVPREQYFFRDHARQLNRVGLIKTSGGLFDHLSGSIRRAPAFMQRAGLEWLWRIALEPRRLFWRYLTTNPAAILALWRYSR